MTDQIVPITAGSGTNIDVSELTVGSNTVERQRLNVADPTAAAGIAGVTARGTQGAYALAVQALSDAGRNVTNYFTAAYTVTSATEALLSLTGYKGGAAATATTTPAVVTTGKTYRIVNITLTYVAIATAGTCRFSLRANGSGVVAVTSPVVDNWFLGASAATAGVSQTVSIDFDQGMEFPAGTGIGVSIIGNGATGTAAAVGYGMASIVGYEY